MHGLRALIAEETRKETGKFKKGRAVLRETVPTPELSFGIRPAGFAAGGITGVGEAYSVQIWLSINAVSCDLDNAPTLVASTEPFLNSISVGMPRMPYLGGVA